MIRTTIPQLISSKTFPPLVSIITPVFNGIRTIKRVMDSILGQSYPHIEWIVIDGGSDDGTVDFLAQNPSDKINWISEPDNGIFDAMNKGIRIASGEWLLFLGVDDYLYRPNVIGQIFGHKGYDSDIVYGDVYFERFRRRYDGPSSLRKLLFINLCHQCIFYRKTVFNKVGAYSLQYRLFSDWEFNLRCFWDESIRKEYLDVIVAFYSDNGTSINGDIEFLRKFLFPANLRYLNKNGEKLLRNLAFYDRWWRLIRSLRLENLPKDILDYAKAEDIPPKIRKIITTQNKISRSLIWNGWISKTRMFLSYLTNH